MQIATTSASPAPMPPRDLIVGEPGSPVASSSDPRFAQFKVIRRNGSVVAFEPAQDLDRDDQGVPRRQRRPGRGVGARARRWSTKLTDAVVDALLRRKPEGGTIHIEDIQDQVELALMRGGEHEVARAYVLYREKRTQERAQERQKKDTKGEVTTLHVLDNGVRKPLDLERLTDLVNACLRGPEATRTRTAS